MKTFSKLLVLALILGVLVGAVFAISAFAESEATTGDGVTYVVPEGNTDTFLLFNAKTGAFIRSAPDLIADSACVVDGVAKNDYILDYDDHNKFVNKASESYYILMQRDYEVRPMWQLKDGEYSQTATLNNFFHLASNFVLDLNGHTMTFSTTIGAQGKGTNGATVNFTFKNGTIVNNGKQVIYFKTGSKANRTCNLTFDNITFTVAEGKKPTYWVQSNAKNTSEKQLNTKITYKNCTFDTTNLKQDIYVSALGVSSNNITNEVEFIDCGLTVNKKYFNPTLTNVAEGSSVTFTATTDDSLTTPYGILPSTYASAEDYPFVLFNLDKNTVLWAGAKWGGETSSSSGTIGGLLEKIYNNKDTNTVSLLRRDFTVAASAEVQYYNFGNTSGTHIIDLGGHTITVPYGGSLFHEQLKYNGAITLFITVKNGTFDLKNKAQLIYLTATAYCDNNTGEESDYMYDPDTHTFYKKGETIPDKVAAADPTNDTPAYYYTSNREKNMSYLFENVKITNLANNCYLVREDSSMAKSLVADIRFKDCDIEYNVARTNPFFYYGQVADKVQKGFFKSNGAMNGSYTTTYTNPAVVKTAVDYVVNVTLEGGTITNLADSSVPAALASTPQYHADKKSITLEKGANGAYTTVTAKSGANVADAKYSTAGGTYYLCQVADTGTNVMYTFSQHGFFARRLTLTSDLNMIYGAFLPENVENPTVTFSIDGFEKTVEAFGQDENGLYLFKLAGITPAKMNEDITATLNAGDLTETSVYSIKAYLDDVKTQYAINEKMVALVESLLVYGAAAQQYEKGNTDGFDAETLEQLDELKAIPADEYDVYKGEGEGVEYFAMNLSGTIYLRVGIVLEDANGVTLEATKGGKTTVYNVANYSAQGGIIAITCDALMATELDEAVTFTLKSADGTVLDTMTCSANAYLFSASNSTIDNLAPLAKAIYAYGVAAKAYKG